MDILIWLQKWYYSNCNEDWEHQFGIHIDTLDNPGWRIKISLIETELESIAFERIEIERNDNDWYQIWVSEGVFEAAGGPKNLLEMLEVFRKWATDSGVEIELPPKNWTEV